MSDDQNEGPKLTVPKFSSFKVKEEPTKEIKEPPKFSSFKTKEPESSPRGEDGSRDHDSRKKRRHHDKSHRSSGVRDPESRDRHRHRERKRTRSRSKTPEERPRAKVPRGDQEDKGTSSLYVIDTKGDPLIRKYGLDKAKVPAYYRFGRGQVLGTEGRLVIHRDGIRDQFSLRMPGQGPALFRDKDGLRSKWRITSKPVQVRRKVAENVEQEDDDFLSLSSKRNQEAASDSSDDEEQPTYRSIEGKAKARRYSDSELSYDSNSEGGVELDEDNPLKWKSIQLARQVKDHPEDIDAWLELVDHQDALLRAGEEIDRKALEAEVHSFTEIKLSMLESALANVTEPRDRERVLVALMREGVKVWNSKTASKKWLEVLKDEQGNFALWKAHLDFAVSNIATFRYEDVKKMHLDRLRQAVTRERADRSIDSIREAIYVFLRATRFIHDAGYKELAVSAWQAILEMNCFRPGQLEDENSIFVAFQDFWESEVPRIGDQDAQGWKAFYESGGIGDPPEPAHDDTIKPTAQSRDAYKAWAVLEQSCAEKAGMPARTMDEGTEDDPFRVVMYSDIESLLFSIPSQLLPSVLCQLVDAFLIFCRSPPVFRADDWTEAAYHDQFLAGGYMECIQPEEQAPASVDDVEIQRKPPSFKQGLVHSAYSPELLFPGRDWFQYVSRDEHFNLAFVTNSTKQLVQVARVEGLSEFCLALCSMQDSTNVKKAAKSLLKQYPSNIGLYNAYALAEFAHEKPDVAIKVLSSAVELAMSTSSRQAFTLWRSWSWLELQRGDKQSATKRLCSVVDEGLREADDRVPVSATHVLKAHQAFTSNRDHYISVGELDMAVVHVEALTLLSYLTSDGCSEPTSTRQGNITAAMCVVQGASHDLKARGHHTSLAHEKILQFAAHLLYLNACRGPFRRAYLLEQFTDFISYFPRNTIFLSLFEWADTSIRVIDDVRSLLDSKVLTPQHDCVSSRIFAIKHEMKRGNVNTTKAAFEHALSSDSCKFNIPLWTWYIRFSSSRRELQAKAKEVLFRALRHCPGAKDVMMEAFLSLNREMESSELRSVFDTMTTKGLRIHVDLEEHLERRRDQRKKKEERK